MTDQESEPQNPEPELDSPIKDYRSKHEKLLRLSSEKTKFPMNYIALDVEAKIDPKIIKDLVGKNDQILLHNKIHDSTVISSVGIKGLVLDVIKEKREELFGTKPSPEDPAGVLTKESKTEIHSIENVDKIDKKTLDYLIKCYKAIDILRASTGLEHPDFLDIILSKADASALASILIEPMLDTMLTVESRVNQLVRSAEKVAEYMTEKTEMMQEILKQMGMMDFGS